jgi:hypothetical protein
MDWKHLQQESIDDRTQGSPLNRDDEYKSTPGHFL